MLTADTGLAATRIGDAACSRTLLHIATDWPGHWPRVGETIAALAAGGADPNARYHGREHDETPLHWAASSDDVEAVDALVAAGADIDARGGVLTGGTPPEDARIFAQWHVARRLVELGASTDLDDEAALGLLDRVAARFGAHSPRPTPEATSRAFWYACHGGRLSTARYLLEAGADLDWMPPWERLAPMDAAERSTARAPADAQDLISWLRSRRAGHAARSAE